MLCHVTKKALKDLFMGYEETLSLPQHVGLTAMFVFVTMLAAIYIPGLQIAMAFSGAFHTTAQRAEHPYHGCTLLVG